MLEIGLFDLKIFMKSHFHFLKIAELAAKIKIDGAGSSLQGGQSKLVS
jgi:hypothetical protein